MSKPVTLRRALLPCIIVFFGVPAIVYGIFVWLTAPSDITDNAALNGGYSRHAIFVIQSPVALIDRGYLVPASEAPLHSMKSTPIVAGTRIRIVRVLRRHDVVADNFPLSIAIGEILDGPFAGLELDLNFLSSRIPDAHRFITPNPQFLALESASTGATAPTSSSRPNR